MVKSLRHVHVLAAIDSMMAGVLGYGKQCVGYIASVHPVGDDHIRTAPDGKKATTSFPASNQYAGTSSPKSSYLPSK